MGTHTQTKKNQKMASPLMKVLRMSRFANLRTINTSSVVRGGGRPDAHGSPHPESGWTKWRTAFFLVAVPAIIGGHLSAFVFVDPEEHKRPDFVPYEHMRIRTKKFPWGDGNHTLFHNPQKTLCPTATRKRNTTIKENFIFFSATKRI